MVRMVNNTTYKKNEMTLPRKPMYNERDVRLLLMSGFSPSKCDRIDERINNSAIKEARGDNTTIAHAPSGWVTIVVSKSCVHGPTSSTTSRIHSCSSPNQVCSSACGSPSRQVIQLASLISNAGAVRMSAQIAIPKITVRYHACFLKLSLCRKLSRFRR